MSNQHLTADQVAAFRDGHVRDRALVRHVRVCLDCQARLREARMLRVLLHPSKPRATPHLGSEDLAAYIDGRDTRRPVPEVEAHLAECPQCFADLEALRGELIPVAASGETPPDRVVAAAARAFHPPRSPLQLGTLIIEWMQRLGLSLNLMPPGREHVSFQMGLRYIGPMPATMSPPRLLEDIPSSHEDEMNLEGEQGVEELLPLMEERRSSESAEPEEFEESDSTVYYERLHLEEEPGPLESKSPQPPASPGPERESAPVELTIGGLRARITARGRPQDQAKIHIAVSRRQDEIPVAGARLALDGDQGRVAEVVTDSAGLAEVPLLHGRVTLAFLSPVHAELTIVF